MSKINLVPVKIKVLLKLEEQKKIVSDLPDFLTKEKADELFPIVLMVKNLSETIPDFPEDLKGIINELIQAFKLS